MKKLMIGLAILGAVMLAPRFALAHEGHDHTVMGTISSIDGTNLMVKTADGHDGHEDEDHPGDDQTGRQGAEGG